MDTPAIAPIIVGTDATPASLTPARLGELEQLARTYIAERYDGDEPIDWGALWADLDGTALPSGATVRVTSPDSAVHRHIRTRIEQL